MSLFDTIKAWVLLIVALLIMVGLFYVTGSLFFKVRRHLLTMLDHHTDPKDPQ